MPHSIPGAGSASDSRALALYENNIYVHCTTQSQQAQGISDHLTLDDSGIWSISTRLRSYLLPR